MTTRNEALEEAAKTCESISRTHAKSAHDDNTLFRDFIARSHAATECADRIRELVYAEPEQRLYDKDTLQAAAKTCLDRAAMYVSEEQAGTPSPGAAALEGLRMEADRCAHEILGLASIEVPVSEPVADPIGQAITQLQALLMELRASRPGAMAAIVDMLDTKKAAVVASGAPDAPLPFDAAKQLEQRILWYGSGVHNGLKQAAELVRWANPNKPTGAALAELNNNILKLAATEKAGDVIAAIRREGAAHGIREAIDIVKRLTEKDRRPSDEFMLEHLMARVAVLEDTS